MTATNASRQDETRQDETVVAGGPGDFMTVRHLVLTGDQMAIGRTLAEEVRTRAGWEPRPVDPMVNRARWSWFERHWPQHHARMSGVADALGLDPERDDLGLDTLSTVPRGSGCSAVFCPPDTAADGRGRLGRNYDFFTMSMRRLGEVMSGEPPSPGDDLPMAARPYVLTTVPDEGLASTVLTMSTLDGAMEGVNEAGLTVALLLADIERTDGPSGDMAPQVGVDTVQLPRFVLDTCENAQARQALLGAKQYDHGMPLHYLVADAGGDSFVWERGEHGTEHIIEAGDTPQCVTNHPLHRHPDVDALPPDNPHTFRTYERCRTLSASMTGGPSTGTRVRESLDAVAMPVAPGEPWRTLWRTVVDVHERTMSTRFYLGDGDGDGDGSTARYSEELVFRAVR
jgi:hypothetical protein